MPLERLLSPRKAIQSTVYACSSYEAAHGRKASQMPGLSFRSFSLALIIYCIYPEYVRFDIHPMVAVCNNLLDSILPRPPHGSD